MPWRKLPYCLFFLFLALSDLCAQTVQLNFSVNPFAPADISKWNQGSGIFFLGANLTAGSATDVKFSFSIKNAGGKEVATTSNPGSLPVITLQPGPNTVNSQFAFDPGDLILAPAYENSLGKTGNLPDGSYDVCVTALSAATNTVISISEACGMLTVEKPQSPLLIYPPDGFELCGNNLSHTVFQWSPLRSETFTPVFFHFVIVELYQGQTPQEALISNIPLAEQFLPSTQSQWQWPENLLPPGDSQNYAWGVNLYDYQDHLLSDYYFPFRTVCRKNRNDTTIIVKDSVPVTVTHTPHTTTRDACSSPGYKLTPGTEVTLGMIADLPALSPYPRAVPLRAEGKDKDVVTLLCSGCRGGTAETPVIVRDDVGNFTWELLSDKGSLQSPFDANAIDSLSDLLARLEKKLSDIKDSIAAVTLAIDPGLNNKRKNLNDNISRINDQIKENTTHLNEINKSLDSIFSEITKKQNQENNIRALMDQKKKAIQKTQARLDSLNTVLKGGPGPEEDAMVKEIGEKRKNIQDEKTALENLEIKWLNELDNLQQDINSAEELLTKKQNIYIKQKDFTENLSLKSDALETAIMKLPGGKDFLPVYDDWKLKLYAFKLKYPGLVFNLESTAMLAVQIFTTAETEKRNAGFESFKSAMQTGLNAAKTGCNKTDAFCLPAVNEITSTGMGFIHLCETMLTGSSIFKLSDFQQLDSLQLQIAKSEAILFAANKAVQIAADAFTKAEKVWLDKVAETEKARNAQLSKISDLTDELSELESRLKKISDQRIADEDNKRQSRLDLKTQVAKALAELESEQVTMGDSLTQIILEIEKEKNLKTELTAKKQTLLDEKTELEKTLEDLKKSLKDLDIEKKQLENSLKQLNLKKAALEKEIEAIKQTKQNAGTGNKIAYGPWVYYIPPPLEDIIKDQQKFQALKDSVLHAESGLKVAYLNKEKLQGQILSEVEKTASNLVKSDNAQKSLTDIESKLTEISDNISKGKNQKYQEYLSKQKEAQDAVIKANTEKEKAEEKAEKADENQKDREKELEDVKEKLDKIKEGLEDKQKEFDARKNEIKKENDLLANSRETLTGYLNALQEAKTAASEKTLAISKLRNDLTRAFALKKEKTETDQIQASIKTAESELKQINETKIPQISDKISSAEQSVRVAMQRVEAIMRTDSLAMLEWKKQLEELRDVSGDLIKANSKYEAAGTESEQANKKKKNAEENAENAEKKRAELQENINDQVEKDADIEKLKKEKTSLEKKKEEAKSAAESANNSIGESIAIVAKLQKKADEEIETAKEKLKNAKDNLRDFLLNEFEKVNFTVTLKLSGKDKVVDGWRTADGEANTIAQLIYSGNRIPTFTGKPAEDKTPSVNSVMANCIPVYGFEKTPDATVIKPGPGAEPRTIALIYKNGEPLWPEWPVIKNNTPLLAKDLIPLVSKGTDNDLLVLGCNPGYNSSCKAVSPTKTPIIDLGTYSWEAKAGNIMGYNTIHPWVWWQAGKVDIPKVFDPQEIKIQYNASELAGDDEQKEKESPLIKAGVLLECSKDTTAIPKDIYKLQGRVVNGEHKGLPGEEVEFKVTLKKGNSDGYGFDGAAKKVSKQTDGNGYAYADFNFGNGFAEFDIRITWKRGGKPVDSASMKAVSPLRLKLYRFSAGAPVFAFDAAMEVVHGDKSASDAIAGFPKKDKNGSSTKSTESEKTATLRGVAGLQDARYGFVNDQTVEYTVSAGKKADPDKYPTKIFGLSRTVVKNIRDKENVTLKASTENKYKPVSRPPTAEKSFNGKKQKNFRIGSPKNPFIIVMDEEFDPGAEISGTGVLGVEMAGTEILQYFKKISLEIDGVTVEGDENELTANAGAVNWNPGNAADFTLNGVTFKFKSLGILAQKGATIKGTASHASIPDPVEFEAELDADGNFLGTVSSMPELEVKKFKLKKGSEFSIDFHEEKSPGTLEASFKGFFIKQASLEFPEVFNGADKTTTELEVTNFYVGSRYQTDGSKSMGFGGSASLKGAFFKMGYAGYEFMAQEFSLEFENSSLKSGGFKGEISLPMPFEGKIATDIKISGEGFSAGVSTDRPVTLPKMGMSMTFLEGSGIEYNSAEKSGKLTINCHMITKGLGEVEVSGFEINSDGTIKAKEITLEKSIKFGSGFDLHARSISFSRTSEEISIGVKGGFSFPKIGIDQLDGEVTVTSGPSLEVKLTGGKIKFEYNPVTFNGEFKYTGREFQGKFDIGIKKVLPQGIQGVFIVGNMEVKDGPSWNYWYAELTVGTKIPMGQTGLVLLGLGGGLGYNYVPPIGSKEGHPDHNESFSFKAIMEMGTQPGGELFSGRMEMVYVPGKFSLYGKCWLLTQKESMFGEGQLNLQWEPAAQIDGYLAMLIGLPNAKGSLFLARGKVNFLFAGVTNYYIKTEEVRASVFQAVNAEASFNFNPEILDVSGKLYFKTNKSVSLGVLGVKAFVDLNANAGLKYEWKKKNLSSQANFSGIWDVDLETPLGNADIINGDIQLKASLNATQNMLEFKASAHVSFDVWVYKDAFDLDLGYKMAI